MRPVLPSVSITGAVGKIRAEKATFVEGLLYPSQLLSHARSHFILATLPEIDIVPPPLRFRMREPRLTQVQQSALAQAGSSIHWFIHQLLTVGSGIHTPVHFN